MRVPTIPVPAVSILAVAVAVVLVGVGGIVVVRALSDHSAAESGRSAQPAFQPGVWSAVLQGARESSTMPPSPGASPSASAFPAAPDDTIGVPHAAPSVPSGTGFLTSGGDFGVAITPAEAQTVAVGLWTMRQKALNAGSSAQLRAIETGVALTADLDILDAIDPACDCLGDYDVLAPSGVSALVPRTASYPASFVGEISSEDDGLSYVDVVVVTRVSASSSWTITLNSGFSLSGDDPAPLDRSGWTDDSHGASSSLDGALGRLADVWQQAKDTGLRDNGEFSDRSWLVSDELDDLASHRQDTPQDNGLRGHFTFEADPGAAPLEVRLVGGDLLCGAIRETVVYTPAPGHAIEQDADQLAFGITVPPGAYREIDVVSEWQICLNQPTGSKVVAIGYDSTYSGGVTGRPEPSGVTLPADPGQRLPGGPDLPDIPGESDAGSGDGSSVSFTA